MILIAKKLIVGMIKLFSKILFQILNLFEYILFKLTKKKYLGYLYDQIRKNSYTKVKINNKMINFFTPNEIIQYRIETYFSKEPETLEWIGKIPSGLNLWDIGANVGLYSIYAAKKGIRVYAFEPSVFNLEVLARNIFLNGVVDKITIIPLPLSDKLVENNLKMTTTEWGGALSTFERGFGHDGETIKEVFEFPTLGISMIDAVERLKIRQPDYIKMDVDGIELPDSIKSADPLFEQVGI